MKIGKIKGSDPERFIVISEAEDPKASFRSDFLTEEQVREIMKRGGASDVQIGALIEQARKHEIA